MKNTQEQFREERSPVFEKYGAMLYRICLSVLHDNYYAEDAVIELTIPCASAEFIGCAGRLEGDKVILDHVPAWGFGAVLLSRA